MAAGTMATAAGAVVLLYYVLIRRLAVNEYGDQSGGLSKSRSGRRRIGRRPALAPATWIETIMTLSETLSFTYSETLRKWPIGDLAFGINYLIRKQDDLQAASVYAGSNCAKLKGPEIIQELNNSLRLLRLCIFFSKKPFPVFLDCAGYSAENVLIQKPKAGILKPAFTVIHDKDSKCFLLLIRGTHSIKDTLTAVTGAVVPFHHSVLHDGGISDLVLGYAHCGMVAAARWIAKLSTPCLLKALGDYPDHGVKVVGHSLGGGTAALLTYILREKKELSSSTCITFAPAACMTWDLAESGKRFITTVINGSDLVPTFSTASIDDLRSEVTASSWLNDLRDQIEHTRVLNVVYRSATALGSHLPSIASAQARVAGARALLYPVSSSTYAVVKRAQNVAQAVVRTHSSLSSWSCMGPRRRSTLPPGNSKVEDSRKACIVSEGSCTIVTEIQTENLGQRKIECSSGSGSGHDDTEEDESLLSGDGVISSSVIEDVTEGELWHELEKELKRQESEDDIQAQATSKEITEEEKVPINTAGTDNSITTTDIPESPRFYPPGRIMHIVSMPASDTAGIDNGVATEEHVGIYETPRELYSKIRLSKRMINDHYMPMYKKMMELTIKQLHSDEDCNFDILQDQIF